MTACRHVFNALVWKHGWRLIQKSRGLTAVMRYNKPSTIDCQAVELSHPEAGAHKNSEKRDYTTTWVKKGVEFEHSYPSYEERLESVLKL
jgi:hypothetical protein